jgi:hypothetical protein
MNIYDFANGLVMPSGGPLDLQSSFSPASISGLVAWYDSADAATVTVDGGGNVIAVDDKAGLGTPRLVASPAGGPVYGQDQRSNNKPAFLWPDQTSAKGLEMDSSADIQCSDVFLVMQYKDGLDAAADQPVSIITNNNGITGSGNRILVNQGLPTIWNKYGMDKVRVNGAAPSNTILPLPLSVVRITRQDNSINTDNAIALNAIGARNNNASNRAWQGVIGEVIAFDYSAGPLSDSDASKVVEYLAAKWETGIV